MFARTTCDLRRCGYVALFGGEKGRDFAYHTHVAHGWPAFWRKRKWRGLCLLSAGTACQNVALLAFSFNAARSPLPLAAWRRAGGGTFWGRTELTNSRTQALPSSFPSLLPASLRPIRLSFQWNVQPCGGHADGILAVRSRRAGRHTTHHPSACAQAWQRTSVVNVCCGVLFPPTSRSPWCGIVGWWPHSHAPSALLACRRLPSASRAFLLHALRLTASSYADALSAATMLLLCMVAPHRGSMVRVCLNAFCRVGRQHHARCWLLACL